MWKLNSLSMVTDGIRNKADGIKCSLLEAGSQQNAKKKKIYAIGIPRNLELSSLFTLPNVWKSIENIWFQFPIRSPFLCAINSNNTQ